MHRAPPRAPLFPPSTPARTVTGKALRRTGFELAKEAYETMQPILKQMKELDLLLSDDEDAAGAGPAGGKRKDGSPAAKGGAPGGTRSRR